MTIHPYFKAFWKIKKCCRGSGASQFSICSLLFELIQPGLTLNSRSQCLLIYTTLTLTFGQCKQVFWDEVHETETDSGSNRTQFIVDLLTNHGPGPWQGLWFLWILSHKHKAYIIISGQKWVHLSYSVPGLSQASYQGRYIPVTVKVWAGQLLSISKCFVCIS